MKTKPPLWLPPPRYVVWHSITGLDWSRGTACPTLARARLAAAGYIKIGHKSQITAERHTPVTL